MLSNTTERSFVLTSPDELLKYPYEHSLNNSYHECRLFYYVHFGSLRSPHCLALQLDFLTPARWLHDSQLPSCTVQHLKHTIKSVIVERKAKKKKKSMTCSSAVRPSAQLQNSVDKMNVAVYLFKCYY